MLWFTSFIVFLTQLSVVYQENTNLRNFQFNLGGFFFFLFFSFFFFFAWIDQFDLNWKWSSTRTELGIREKKQQRNSLKDLQKAGEATNQNHFRITKPACLEEKYEENKGGWRLWLAVDEQRKQTRQISWFINEIVLLRFSLDTKTLF